MLFIAENENRREGRERKAHANILFNYLFICTVLLATQHESFFYRFLCVFSLFAYGSDYKCYFLWKISYSFSFIFHATRAPNGYSGTTSAVEHKALFLAARLNGRKVFVYFLSKKKGS